jgi:hypothetical protein
MNKIIFLFIAIAAAVQDQPSVPLDLRGYITSPASDVPIGGKLRVSIVLTNSVSEPVVIDTTPDELVETIPGAYRSRGSSLTYSLLGLSDEPPLRAFTDGFRKLHGDSPDSPQLTLSPGKSHTREILFAPIWASVASLSFQPGPAHVEDTWVLIINGKEVRVYCEELPLELKPAVPRGRGHDN